MRKNRANLSGLVMDITVLLELFFRLNRFNVTLIHFAEMANILANYYARLLPKRMPWKFLHETSLPDYLILPIASPQRWSRF